MALTQSRLCNHAAPRPLHRMARYQLGRGIRVPHDRCPLHHRVLSPLGRAAQCAHHTPHLSPRHQTRKHPLAQCCPQCYEHPNHARARAREKPASSHQVATHAQPTRCAALRRCVVCRTCCVTVSDGRLERSGVDRTSRESALLDERGDAILIVHLHGHLFFGSANSIHAALRSHLTPAHAPRLVGLLLSFEQCSAVDATAIAVLIQTRSLLDRCGGSGARLLFCAMDERMRSLMDAASEDHVPGYEVRTPHCTPPPSCALRPGAASERPSDGALRRTAARSTLGLRSWRVRCSAAAARWTWRQMKRLLMPCGLEHTWQRT
jgi:anti-anti-sigma regulatory factor